MIAKTSIIENPGMALVVIGLVFVLGYTFKTAFWESNEAVHSKITCQNQFRGKAVEKCAEQIKLIKERCERTISVGGGHSLKKKRRCREKGIDTVLSSLRRKYPNLVVEDQGSTAPKASSGDQASPPPPNQGGQRAGSPPTSGKSETKKSGAEQGARNQQPSRKKGVQPSRPFKPSRPLKPSNPVDEK